MKRRWIEINWIYQVYVNFPYNLKKLIKIIKSSEFLFHKSIHDNNAIDT